MTAQTQNDKDIPVANARTPMDWLERFRRILADFTTAPPVESNMQEHYIGEISVLHGENDYQRHHLDAPYTLVWKRARNGGGR